MIFQRGSNPINILASKSSLQDPKEKREKRKEKREKSARVSKSDDVILNFTVCRGHYRSLQHSIPPLPIQAIIHASIIQDHVLPLLFMRLHVRSRCRRKARQIWPVFITWLQSHLLSLRTIGRKRLIQCVVQIHTSSFLVVMATNGSAWCVHSNTFLFGFLLYFLPYLQGCNNSMSASKQKQKTTSS